MLENIPRNRLIFYGLILGCFPILSAFFYFLSAESDLSQLKNSIIETKTKAFAYDKRQAVNQTVIEHYRHADHFYIDKNLESLTFLEPEIGSLQKLMNNKNFAFDESVKKRLDFLTKNNRLVLTEGVVQNYPQFQETLETAAHPVEVNMSDIQQLLSHIEGVELGTFVPKENAPQLLILDFKIDRKNISEKNQVYNLSLKLLKREFL